MRGLTSMLAISGIISSIPGVVLAQDTARGPAIVIFAAASAKEVTFRAQPVVRVVLTNGTVDSVRVVERRNLPDPVQPGVVYRDVYIAVEILGHLNATCLASQLTGEDVAACRKPQRDPD